MVPAHYQVVGAVVAANNRVPQGLPRTAHAHRERQKCQDDSRRLVVPVGQRPVRADPGVVVDVAWLGEAYHGVQQQDAVNGVRGALGQLLVDAMERVACLEGDDVVRSELVEPGPAVGRREAKVPEVEVAWKLQHSQSPGNVHGAPSGHLRDDWMALVTGAEDLLRDLLTVPLVCLLDGHYRKELVLGVAERDLLVQVDVARLDRKRDRNRKEPFISQTHLSKHACVVVAAHKPVERREPAGRQQLQITDRPVRKLDGRETARPLLELFPILRRYEKVYEAPTVGCYKSWLRRVAIHDSSASSIISIQFTARSDHRPAGRILTSQS